MFSPAEESAAVGVAGIVGEVTGSGTWGVGVALGITTALTVDEAVATASVTGTTCGSDGRVATSGGAGTSDLAQARAARRRLPMNNWNARECMGGHVPLPGSAPDLVFIIPTRTRFQCDTIPAQCSIIFVLESRRDPTV